jgi:hypothetical protein
MKFAGIELRCVSERPKIVLTKSVKINASHSMAIVSLTSVTIRHGLLGTSAQLLAIRNVLLKMQCVLTIAAMRTMCASKYLELMKLTSNNVLPRGLIAISVAKSDATMVLAKTSAATSTTLAHPFLDQELAGTIVTNALSCAI